MKLIYYCSTLGAVASSTPVQAFTLVWGEACVSVLPAAPQVDKTLLWANEWCLGVLSSLTLSFSNCLRKYDGFALLSR